MSTTETHPADDHVSPQRAFDRIVWHTPRVCNGCFELVKEIEEATFNGGINDHDVQEHHRTTAATLEPDEQIHTSVDGVTTRPGQQRTSIARTTCRSCARVGCWADDETLSKVQALRLTAPLANRLEEANVEFDRYTLREFVRIAKGLDKYAGYDTEIFRCAVKMAMWRA
ncbi:uncharacterized protein Nmag_1656 [Natrialba magadii ATCC 43099]|nr:hypothetical protein [Natrialba magadii]ADD05232.1 uncharacterized protein Nmag_1656 [Natrialba magadii ATCC 43099]